MSVESLLVRVTPPQLERIEQDPNALTEMIDRLTGDR
jgi:hypothetical protein